MYDTYKPFSLCFANGKVQRSDMNLQAIVNDFLTAKSLTKSPNTINDYSLTMRRVIKFFGCDRDFSTLTASDIRDFLSTIPGCQKNVLNASIAVSSLYTWAVNDGIVQTHIMRMIEFPKPDIHVINPFTENDVKKMLNFNYKYENFKVRNRAIILLLLDTGIRASELCGIEIAAIREAYVTVLGKGRKERGVPISEKVMRALLEYLHVRTNSKNSIVQQERYLFVSRTGKQMSRLSLLKMIHHLGIVTGVDKAHPHRFRHTFAVNYLLNGGDPYTLQRILGHTTMDMVSRYLDFTQSDLVKVHRRSSPVSNWDL